MRRLGRIAAKALLDSRQASLVIDRRPLFVPT
jgi:hypothetical protein